MLSKTRIQNSGFTGLGIGKKVTVCREIRKQEHALDLRLLTKPGRKRVQPVEQLAREDPVATSRFNGILNLIHATEFLFREFGIAAKVVGFGEIFEYIVVDFITAHPKNGQ